MRKRRVVAKQRTITRVGLLTIYLVYSNILSMCSFDVPEDGHRRGGGGGGLKQRGRISGENYSVQFWILFHSVCHYVVTVSSIIFEQGSEHNIFGAVYSG